MPISLDGVSKHYGATTVLDNVTLSVTPERRLGVVGPNGVGKSTLLRLIAGDDRPDSGRVTRMPATLTAGYLPQERDRRTGETLLEYLARRTGVAAAQHELEEAASSLAAGDGAEERFAAALDRFVALGGGDLEARVGQGASELGLPVSLEREFASLSGGEAARVALAAILLSRFDVLLLDEPTNDLDFDGLERLERFLAARDGGLVVVSHDREFLDRTVTRIVEIEPGSRRVREWTGGFSEYEAARDAARAAAYERFEHAEERRREIETLLARRRQEARAGAGLGEKTGGADRRGTNALRSKVRLAERALERADRPLKPFEPWELRLRLEAGERAGDRVASLDTAVAVRGEFTLGPMNLVLGRGERVIITGRNGSGKSTLLGMLLGEVPLAAGSRFVGRRTVTGTLDQGRGAYEGDDPLLERFRVRAGMSSEEARTLLAKFGSAPTTSAVPVRRSRPANGHAPTLPSCRHAASTCSSSTSPPTTSTWRQSSSSSRPSRTTTAPSYSSATTAASCNAWARRGRSGSRTARGALAAASKGPARLVAAPPRADGDEGHPLGAGDRTARRPRVEAEEGAFADGDLLALDTPDSRPAHDDVDLLLLRAALVVRQALGVRRKVEPVDPERLDTEHPPHEPNGAARPGRLDLVDVHDAVAHTGGDYPAAILLRRMAVPKRKTSKARRDKRRAQHRIEAPRLSVCPRCHQPKRSHEMCPNCKTYRGREIEPLRTLTP